MTHKILLLGLIFFVTACGTPNISTPAPTPEAINIYYPASLQPWADRLSDCSANYPQIALYFIQLTGTSFTINSNDILLDFGQSTSIEDGSPYLAQVGEEQVVVITNLSNPLSVLSTSQLRQIFSGQTLNWELGMRQPIQVWVLPDSELTRQIFDQALNLSQLLAPDARLAPDPQAMLKAVAEDESAIGYLPRSFLNPEKYSGVDQVKLVTLDASLAQELSQPVVASTQSEPSGYKRDLIACLQNKIAR